MSNINSVDNTQSEEMRQVVKYFAANMMKSCLKSSMGEDNNNFDLMYEALLESLEDKTSSISTMLDEVCDSMMGTSQSAIGNNSSSSNSSSSSSSYGYPSNPKDYSDYEDYYYDNEEDFDGIDDAESYYDEYGDD